MGGHAELPMRHRHLGLHPTEPLPPNVDVGRVMALSMHLAPRGWSTDPHDLERVLAWLRASLTEEAP